MSSDKSNIVQSYNIRQGVVIDESGTNTGENIVGIRTVKQRVEGWKVLKAHRMMMGLSVLFSLFNPSVSPSQSALKPLIGLEKASPL